MATGKALNGKPYAGNPHVRFDEGEVASAATPRRGSLLYRRQIASLAAAGIAGLAVLSIGAARGEGLNAFSYIQKGLVACYDGIENAGAGLS